MKLMNRYFGKKYYVSIYQVADINPLSGIKTAMRRRPPTWKDAWIPSECISLDDAIKATGFEGLWLRGDRHAEQQIQRAAPRHHAL